MNDLILLLDLLQFLPPPLQILHYIRQQQQLQLLNHQIYLLYLVVMVMKIFVILEWIHWVKLLDEMIVQIIYYYGRFNFTQKQMYVSHTYLCIYVCEAKNITNWKLCVTFLFTYKMNHHKSTYCRCICI